jgi:DNA-binding MarR family transcriptional regulator
MLRVLWEEEGLTQAELSARVGIMTPTAVSTLNALARRGLIVRRAHPDDKRKHRVFLTRKGRQLEKDLIPLARRAHSSALKGISPGELADVRRVLDAIKANISQEVGK